MFCACSILSGCPSRSADLFPHEFSGGQRQRIAIARALAAVAETGRARRARLGAGCVDPCADPEPVARSAGATAVVLPVHCPRPRSCCAHEPHDRRHVPRQDRRNGRRTNPRAGSEASLYEGTLLSSLAEPSRREPRRDRSCRRGAEPIASAFRLSFPSALSAAPCRSAGSRLRGSIASRTDRWPATCLPRMRLRPHRRSVCRALRGLPASLVATYTSWQRRLSGYKRTPSP